MKVLIVDDFPVVIFMLRKEIEVLWPQAVPLELIGQHCPTPADAIAAIQKEVPDVLFLDYGFGYKHEDGGKEIANWIDSQGFVMKVATHSDRRREVAMSLFGGNQCVTHFLGKTEERQPELQKFVEYCTTQLTTNLSIVPQEIRDMAHIVVPAAVLENWWIKPRPDSQGMTPHEMWQTESGRETVRHRLRSDFAGEQA